MNSGVLVVMVTDTALATAVTTIKALVEDFTPVKPLVFREVGSILFVLLVFIVAALESVLDVRVAPHM